MNNRKKNVLNGLASFSNFVDKVGVKHVVAFLVLVSVVIISIFARTPFSFFDEHIHYIRAVGVSSGQLTSYSQTGKDDDYGHDVDSSVRYYVDDYLDSANSTRVSVDWVGEVGSSGHEFSGEEEYLRNTTAAPYSPISYIAPALGYRLAEVMGFDLLGGFVMMRLFGALVALLIVGLALRVSPRKYRWTIVVIAMLPMSISTFAAISADSFTLAISLLFIAYLMRVVGFIKSSNLNSKHIAVLGVISVLLTGAKMPAFLLIAMIVCVILVYWRRISLKHRLLLSSIVAIAAFITVVWLVVVMGVNTGGAWGRDVDTFRQLEFIFSNPVAFLINLFYSVISFPYNDITYTLYADGSRYITMPFLIDMLLIVALFLSSFIDVDKSIGKSKEDNRLYIIQSLLFAMIVMSIFTILYLQFTPVGVLYSIDGVQARYFLPFIALVAMMPYSVNLSKFMKCIVIAAPFVGVLVYLLFILIQII